MSAAAFFAKIFRSKFIEIATAFSNFFSDENVSVVSYEILFKKLRIVIWFLLIWHFLKAHMWGPTTIKKLRKYKQLPFLRISESTLTTSIVHMLLPTASSGGFSVFPELRKSSNGVFWKYLEPSILPSKEPGLAIVRNSRWCKTVRKGSKKLWMKKRMNTWSRKHNWSGLDTWLTNKEFILQKIQLTQ